MPAILALSAYQANGYDDVPPQTVFEHTRREAVAFASFPNPVSTIRKAVSAWRYTCWSGQSGARVAESYLYCPWPASYPSRKAHGAHTGASDEASRAPDAGCAAIRGLQRDQCAAQDAGFSAH